MKLLPCGLAVVLVAVLSSTGWARIGETLEQCIARYGEPVGEPERVEGVPEALTYMFLKGGISRFVTIWRSKAADIMFINQVNDRFSSAEVEKLLPALFEWTLP